ncbi:MAG TPA: hypothetical protein VF786_02730 [Terriglobales bacterium]
MSVTSYDVRLAPETITDFDAYVASAEKAMLAERRTDQTRLWSTRVPQRWQKIHTGEPVVEMWSGNKPIGVRDGLIHDWIGAVFVREAAIADVLAVMQDYDNHHAIYAPEVIGSKLISRRGNDFKIYLRLLKKKVITVVLDTEHDVNYSALDANCWTCTSYTTRIAEVQDPGTPKETALPPGTGHGFLWRLYSYWLLQESEQGTIVECRAISLTRTIPFSLKLVVQPIVRNLPRESLASTLAATQNAVQANLSGGSARAPQPREAL